MFSNGTWWKHCNSTLPGIPGCYLNCHRVREEDAENGDNEAGRYFASSGRLSSVVSYNGECEPWWPTCCHNEIRWFSGFRDHRRWPVGVSLYWCCLWRLPESNRHHEGHTEDFIFRSKVRNLCYDKRTMHPAAYPVMYIFAPWKPLLVLTAVILGISTYRLIFDHVPTSRDISGSRYIRLYSIVSQPIALHSTVSVRSALQRVGASVCI